MSGDTHKRLARASNFFIKAEKAIKECKKHFKLLGVEVAPDEKGECQKLTIFLIKK